MIDNISHAKNNINSENYEIALQFLDKELEQNSNKITNEIYYYKGIVLIHIGAIKGKKIIDNIRYPIFRKTSCIRTRL